MTQNSGFCQFPETLDPESALERILEVEELPMEAALLAVAALKAIKDQREEMLLVLAERHAEQCQLESGYGM
jgi:hypothetical protein